MLVRVVIVVETAKVRKRLQRLVVKPDVLATAIRPGAGLVERLARENSDLILISGALLGEPPGRTVSALRHLPDRPDVVVLQQAEDARQRARLLAAGACAVACMALPDDALAELFEALTDRRAEGMLTRLGAERGTRQVQLADFVSSSPSMHAFMETVYRIVGADSSLLVLGETGVGKEHLARAIHHASPRAGGAFVALNCGALAESLLESELFGHEEGAFTGATKPMRGQFELAHRGTIFLDEIGEMPTHLQVKLLQVLESRQIRRVGGERPIDIDVRVMAATNRNLLAEIGNGRFRADLYYRLGALALTIPPLRERREDIAELAENSLVHFRTATSHVIHVVTAEAMAALRRYTWPGNVRELINVIERAVLLCAGDQITLSDLPPSISGLGNTLGCPTPPPQAAAWCGMPDAGSLPLRAARRLAIDDFERAYIERLLHETGGRIDRTARRAGMTTRSLYDRMRRLGLHKENFRNRTGGGDDSCA